jgi:predicted PurR-regulated permease PerM
MAWFLQLVAVAYLALDGLVLYMAFRVHEQHPDTPPLVQALVVVCGIIAAIPAALIYALASIVRNVAQITSYSREAIEAIKDLNRNLFDIKTETDRISKRVERATIEAQADKLTRTVERAISENLGEA